jgi:hypothetical protein
MTTGYRDGAANWSSASPFTLAIPSDVQAGDIVVVYASVFNATATINLTGSVNTPTRLVPMSSNGVNDSCTAWAFVAEAGDAGATLTYTEVGASTYIGSAIVAYYGAGMPLATTAYALGGFDNADTDSWPAPSLAEGAPVAGCWGLYFISAGVGDGDGGATYAGGTLRTQSTASGINACDSNGPLGAAGVAVGGGTWTTVADGPVVGITIALPPATATGAAALSAPASLAAASVVARRASAALSASSSLSASGTAARHGAVSLSAPGSLTSVGTG